MNLPLTFIADCACDLMCALRLPFFVLIVVVAWLSRVTHLSMDLRSYYKSPEAMKFKWYLRCFRTYLIVPPHRVLFPVLALMGTTANSVLSVLLKNTKKSSQNCN